MTTRLVNFLRTQKVWLRSPQLVESNPLMTRTQLYYHREENPFHWLCTVGRGSALAPQYQAQIIYTTWVEDSRMVNAPTITEVVGELVYDAHMVYYCPEYQDWLRRFFKSRLACHEETPWLKYLHARQLRSFRRLKHLMQAKALDQCYGKNPQIVCPDRSHYPVCVFAMTTKSLAAINQTQAAEQPTPVEVHAPVAPVTVKVPVPMSA